MVVMNKYLVCYERLRRCFLEPNKTFIWSWSWWTNILFDMSAYVIASYDQIKLLFGHGRDERISQSPRIKPVRGAEILWFGPAPNQCWFPSSGWSFWNTFDRRQAQGRFGNFPDPPGTDQKPMVPKPSRRQQNHSNSLLKWTWRLAMALKPM